MRFIKNPRFLVLLAALFVLFGARELRLSDPPFVKSLRELTFDSYQRIKPREPLGQPIRIIDIDEDSIAEFGQWPWPRTRIAQMVDRLTELGAACVAFDIVFSEPDRTGPAGMLAELRERDLPGRETLEPLISKIPDNDMVLAEAMARAPTVLGFFNSAESRLGLPEPKAGFVLLGADPASLLLPVPNAVISLPFLREASIGSGLISLGGQADAIVRRVPMFMQGGNGKKYPAMSIETLRVVQGAPSYALKTTEASGEISAGGLAITAFQVGQFEVPVTREGDLRVYYAPNDSELYVPARDLLSQSSEKLAPLLAGHIVFIGVSAQGLRDIRSTALGEEVPGVSIHAQIVDQILSGAFLNRPDWALGVELATMFVATLLLVGFLSITGAVISGILGVVVGGALLAGSWYAFSNSGLLLDPVFPMLTAGTIFLGATIFNFAYAEREKRFVRGAFQRYIAPDLLKKLEDHPETLRLGGEIRDMTLMFMDVRGFTPISEKLTPEELVAFLNQLLSPLSDAILAREGAIDKYIGDSIMAFWNAPLDVADHRRKAARAALDMIAIVEQLNRNDAFGFRSSNKGPRDVQIGIGLNSGAACVGNMGSTSRFNYSVVGDTVNVAARIESSCKAVGWPVLLSEDTAAAVTDFALLEAGAIALKGKSKPVKLYALLGDEKRTQETGWDDLLAAHTRMLEAMRAGNNAQAKRVQAECLALAREDLATFYDNLLASGRDRIAAE
ncbi:MAG: adenylate/guanylate cyclase domain-containing protein [Pseudomonadota bacterium]|nr:adenylate/guanylate cyclase domain-containing protein [Pseudomonadota bacterium]